MILLALGIMQAVYAQNHLTEEVFTGAAVPVYAQKQQGPGETTLELKRDLMRWSLHTRHRMRRCVSRLCGRHTERIMRIRCFS